MDEDEKNNLFGTFESVVQSAYNEKKEQPAWKNKIATADLKCNLGLQIAKDEFYYVNLIIQQGNLQFNKGKLEGKILEMLADPVDFLFYANNSNSILHMMTKKSQYGLPKLMVKNGGKNIKALLFIAKFLVFN